MKEKALLAKKEPRLHGSYGFPLAYYRLEYKKDQPEEPLLVQHHWHEEVEMIYLEQGEFQVEVNMKRWEIREPCFCFLNREELHSLECRKSFLESAVVFLPQMLLFGGEDGVQKNYLRPLAEGKLALPRFLRLGEAGFAQVREAYLRIAGCFEAAKPGTEAFGRSETGVTGFGQLRVKGALLEILAVLGEQGLLRMEAPALDPKAETVKNALSYMQEHFGEKIYMKDLARLSNMNEQYFCRFFKSVIGKPPMAYLNDIRIGKAARLLKETDHPVTAVCLETGFHNLGNFLRVFREAYGCTPLQFRKQTGAVSNGAPSFEKCTDDK